jgi:DUF4097 and DUF4098 domain-containing protein YvlB
MQKTHYNMKKILLLVTALTSMVFANAQNEKEPYMTKSLSGDNVNAAKVETSGGSIQVSGVAAGEARIEVYVRPSNSRNDWNKEEIKKRLEDDYTLEVGVSGNKLTAIARQKRDNMNWKNALSISFRIYIPANSSTDLSTSGGSIHLENLNGNHDFRTSGGSLHMDKLAGKIKGRTSGGSITIAHSKDDIDLHTSGGSITAEDCIGTMELITSGGSLNLRDLLGSVEARTSGGSIRGDDIKADLVAHTSGGSVHLKDISGSLDAATSGGGVHVELTQLGKFVKLSNSGGNIDLTLPADKGMDLKLSGDRVNTGSLKNFSGKMEENEVNGTLNGGGVPVTVRSSSGRVTLTFK